MLYGDGWGKKMSYVVAYSIDGAVDVTRRYVRDPAKSVPRNKISEDELASVLKSITAKLRSHLPPAEREQLEKEDKIEQEELAGFGQSPSSTGPVGPRTTGSEDWIKSRGEDGHS